MRSSISDVNWFDLPPPGSTTIKREAKRDYASLFFVLSDELESDFSFIQSLDFYSRLLEDLHSEGEQPNNF
jgi:hypothetical protein